MPPGQIAKAKVAKRKFEVAEGDLLTLLNVFNAFKSIESSSAKHWCSSNFLRYKALVRADQLFEVSMYLNNYFDFHVCLSILPLSVRSSVRPVLSAKKLTSTPASVSQNVTKKSCLVCVKSEKYASLVTLRPQ